MPRLARYLLPLFLLTGCITKPEVQHGFVEQAFERLKQQPSEPQPLLDLAQHFLNQRDYLRARQYLGLAENHPGAEPRKDEIFRLYVLISVRAKQYRDAISRCEQRLRDREELAVRVLLASLWEALPDVHAAERERQLILIQHPDAVEHWVELGRFYERTSLPGAREQARRAYEKYLKLSPAGLAAEQARAALRTLAFDAEKAAN